MKNFFLNQINLYSIVSLFALCLELFAVIPSQIEEGVRRSNSESFGDCIFCFFLLSASFFMIVGTVFSAFKRKSIKCISIIANLIALCFNGLFVIDAIDRRSRFGVPQPEIASLYYAYWNKMLIYEYLIVFASAVIIIAIAFGIVDLIKKPRPIV